MRPMTLFDCLGDDLATLLIAQSTAVAILYFAIGLKFYQSYKKSSLPRERAMWMAMAVLFPSCGLCGYGTTILAGWCPEFAYAAKAVMMFTGIIACIVFLRCCKGVTLSASREIKDRIDFVERRAVEEDLSAEQIFSLVKKAIALKRS